MTKVAKSNKGKRLSPSQKLKKKQNEASKPKGNFFNCVVLRDECYSLSVLFFMPPDYQTSLELAPMISDAIKGKNPLYCSGDKVSFAGTRLLFYT